MISRELNELRRQARARDVALVDVLRQFAARDKWLRARLVELHIRVKALDGVTPEVPDWPAIVVPRALEGLLEPEG